LPSGKIIPVNWVPIIAGWYKRKFPVMNLIARPLSDEDIANVAAFFASLPGTPKGAKK